MKAAFWRVAILSCCGLCYSLSALADSASQQLLQDMKRASSTLDYDMAFVNIDPQQGVESMFFRHAVINNQPVAQLLQMDGPRREVVQRGNEISYFDPGLDPFTLPGNYIIYSLPSLVYANFQQLEPYYDFIPVGRTRIADTMCEVVRVVPRDGLRYNYVVWLDTKTSLPLRVDLLDNNGETLEQFRVISYSVNKHPDAHMLQIPNAKLPPLLAVPLSNKQHFDWQPGWLPAGFKEMSGSQRQIPGIDKPVESRLYSDGLFSFSLNVSQTSANSVNQLLRIGRRTVNSQISHNREITLVGELPPAVAKRIISSIKFTASK